MLGDHVLGLKAVNKDGEVSVRSLVADLTTLLPFALASLLAFAFPFRVISAIFMPWMPSLRRAPRPRIVSPARGSAAGHLRVYIWCKEIFYLLYSGIGHRLLERYHHICSFVDQLHHLTTNLVVIGQDELEVEQPKGALQVSVRAPTCLSGVLRKSSDACLQRLREEGHGRVSGAKRKAFIASFLQQLADGTGIQFHVRDEWDLADKSLQERLLRELAQGRYHVVLITPPCSTWFRVRGANCRGPTMVRSRARPSAFPWLSKRHQRDAELGNALIRFMIEVLHILDKHPRAHDGSLALVFGEHPEDLGVIWREEDNVEVHPASIWQLSDIRQCAQPRNSLLLHTVAFNQCCWRAPYRKPTRLLTNHSLAALGSS